MDLVAWVSVVAAGAQCGHGTFSVLSALLSSDDDFTRVDSHRLQVFASRWQDGSELSAHQ